MLAKKDNTQVASTETMSRCALQAGDTLQLQFLDEPERGRYPVTIIGYVEDCSLMITAPKMNGHILLLREGQQFVVRLLSGKQVIGFNSEVLKVYNNPFAYVHLKPPVEVQQCKVRNAYRVNMDDIASIQCVDDEGNSEQNSEKNKSSDILAAKILDMSTTGCQLQLLNPLPEKMENIIISTKVKVAEQERLLSLEAQVCSHREAENNNKQVHLYGVKFMETNDDKRLLLNGFVYEKLVHEKFRD